MTITLNEGQPS